MDYEIETLVLLTVPYEGQDKKIRYQLDSCGKRNLKSKSLSVLESKDPHVLVFGTCFSKKSEVNDIICANGLYPALFLSADLGYITDGKQFKHDDQQNDVIRTVVKVTP